MKSFTYPLVQNGGSYSLALFYILRNYATIRNNLWQWRTKDYVTLHKKRIFRYSLESINFHRFAIRSWASVARSLCYSWDTCFHFMVHRVRRAFCQCLSNKVSLAPF